MDQEGAGKEVECLRYYRMWGFGMCELSSSRELNSLEGQQPPRPHQLQLPGGRMKLPGKAAWDAVAKHQKPF